jgi:CheY-like chemotaxis protein
MTGANPVPREFKVIDLNRSLARRAAMPAPAEEDLVNDNALADDELVSLRSHELRTRLASMVGLAELVHSGDLTVEQSQLYVGILLREGRRLTALINNALALQRLETGRRELGLAPLDLRSLIRRAVVAAGEDDRRPIGVKLPEHLPLIDGDAEALLEVLANFLANARRFSPDGGAITIGARPAGDMVEVYVKDHGVGVEAEALPLLFRKFYRTDGVARRLGPGAGFALPMNYRIIEAHGGRLEAASKGPGKGTRFQFTLPISRPRPGSGDVLIVEDDAAFARLMKAEFSAQGLSTVRAADAETAEHMLVDMTARAIVLDLLLPGLQGEDFLARISAGSGTRLPVVVVTAKELAPAEISALETAGAIAVLPKEAGAPQAAVALIAEALALDRVAG